VRTQTRIIFFETILNQIVFLDITINKDNLRAPEGAHSFVTQWQRETIIGAWVEETRVEERATTAVEVVLIVIAEMIAVMMARGPNARGFS